MTYKIISANRSRGFSSQSGQSGLIIHLRYAPSFSSISWAFTRLYKALQGFTSLCKPVQALGMGCIWISILPYVSYFCLGVFVVQIDGRNFLSYFLWLVWSIFSRKGVPAGQWSLDGLLNAHLIPSRAWMRYPCAVPLYFEGPITTKYDADWGPAGKNIGQTATLIIFPLMSGE